MLPRTALLAFAGSIRISSAKCDAELRSKVPGNVQTSKVCMLESSAGPYLIKRHDEFYRKMEAMKKAGASRLQIVTDFDFTLTKFYQASSGRAYSCHKCLEDCGYLSESYHEKAQALQRKYYPLEVDPSLDDSTRIKYMVEWVTKAHALLLRSGLTEATLKKAVKHAIDVGGMVPRAGLSRFFSVTGEQGVPVLVFSAGIANVLEEVLRQAVGGIPPHVGIASNRILFDAKGCITGFDQPLFHVFNKRASALKQGSAHILDKVSSRHNVVLIGDSLGDLNMSVGLEDTANILRIGFLNDRQERLPEYLEKFDVVLLGDGSLDQVIALLAEITGSK